MRRKMMRKLVHPFMFFFFLFFFFSSRSCGAVIPARSLPVGLILDLGTPLGRMCEASVLVALDDFYRSHADHAVRLEPHTRDSREDVVGAASAAVDLLKNADVQAILGPITSAQARFLIDLGQKSQVPIISFSATSPSISPRHTPFFVRAASDDSSQVGAIASIVQAFGWRFVVPVYEDTDYGAGVVPYLTNAFQAIDARFTYHSVISPSATDHQILEELYKLKTMQTRVFVVHMSSSLGSRLFTKANEAGMVAEEYVWIITDGLSSLLDSLEPKVIESMHGVLGVKPHVPRSKELVDFVERWRARLHDQDYSGYWGKAEPNIFCLRAYDTTWALAMAAEKLEPSASGRPLFQRESLPRNTTTDLDGLGVSRVGSRLLDVVLKTEFGGISGEFHVVDGQLQSSAFQIVNVVGNGWKTVGFWTPSRGITRRLDSTGSSSSSGAALGPVFWPGNSTSVPRGWENPTSGKKLKIGVPVRKGFKEFLQVMRDPLTNRTAVTGYCIDVFEAVMAELPYAVPYKYVPFEMEMGKGATYDRVYHSRFQKYDAVVGDMTITANRSRYMDFTLPYAESSVSMVVPVKRDGDGNAWIFLKPLPVEMWLVSLAFFFFTGFVVWIIEHRVNREFRGPPSQHIGNIVYFAFSTLVFAHKDRIESNLSRFVVIIWVFVVLILASSYTASLSSMLTVQKLRPTVVDVKQLLENGDCVGYQEGSFVGELLKQLNFDQFKLKTYRTPDEYAEALQRGSQNGGVAAIFEEAPYIKIFLSQKGSDFAMVGPTYKTDGFGFAFPRGSPLVPDVSRAILTVTQGDLMPGIERKWFGDLSAYARGTEDTSLNSSGISIGSFWGLFLITGAASTSALLAFFVGFLCENWGVLKTGASGRSMLEKITALAKRLDQKDLTSYGFTRDESLVSSSTLYGDESSRRTVGGEGVGRSYAVGSLRGRSGTADSCEISSSTSGEALPSTELCGHSVEVLAAAASNSDKQQGN